MDSTRPSFVVLVTRRDAPKSANKRISDALRANLPAALPDFEIRFGAADEDDELFSFLPIRGSVGELKTPPFKRAPTEAEFAEVSNAIACIVTGGASRSS